MTRSVGEDEHISPGLGSGQVEDTKLLEEWMQSSSNSATEACLELPAEVKYENLLFCPQVV